MGDEDVNVDDMRDDNHNDNEDGIHTRTKLNIAGILEDAERAS
jgi:hypothetical protein